jgi:hypothetical protein
MKIAIAVLVGFVAFVLLFPASASTDVPPECYSLIAYYDVSCNAGVAWAAGAAAAGLVGLTLWMIHRLRERRGSTSG